MCTVTPYVSLPNVDTDAIMPVIYTVQLHQIDAVFNLQGDTAV